MRWIVLAPLIMALVSSGCVRLHEARLGSSLSSRCRYLDETLDFTAKELLQELKQRPKCGAYSNEDYLEILVSLLQEETVESELALEERVFKTIGLIPNDYSYSSCIHEAFFQEAAAFYSPSRQEIVLPKWSESNLTTLLHESIHYLQDETLNLAKNKHLKGLFSDSALAVGAILEGDAEYQTERLLQKAAEMIPLQTVATIIPLSISKSECQLPAKLQSIFQFQYEYGYMFWSKVNQEQRSPSRLEILHSPPLQTRFILHPDDWVTKANIFNSGNERSCRVAKSGYAKSLGAISLMAVLNRIDKKDNLRKLLKELKTDCLTDENNILQWAFTWETEEAADAFFQLIQTTKDEALPTSFWHNPSKRGRVTTFKQVLLL